MKILLVNDDGLNAAGLWAAVRALRQLGEVCVVAPDREQSGVGASLTLHAPVRVRPAVVDASQSGDGTSPYPLTVYAVEGTPGDSCILALESVVGKVDLVVSGINSGSNVGWDIMVSGTVGAAIQGYVRGYPTIAISVGSVQDPRFGGAARLLQLIGHRLSQQPPDSHFFLNINVPSVPVEQIAGVQVTRLGNRSYGESVREEGMGAQKRYWISRNRPITTTPDEGTDIWALRNNHISITPLQVTLGCPEQMPAIEALLDGIAAQLLGSRD